MDAAADTTILYKPLWGPAPIAERTIVTTRIVRHRGCGCHAKAKIRSVRTVTVSQTTFSNGAIGERVVTTTYSGPNRFVFHRVVYRGGALPAVGERTMMTSYSAPIRYAPRSTVFYPNGPLPAIGEQVEYPVVGGRRVEMIRTTPTPVGEGWTEPGPTVSPAYPNAWVDYNNPYR